MKRSRALALTLMATGGFALSACGDDPAVEQVDGIVYPSLEACIAEKKFTPEYCEKTLKEAQEQHALSAPRFDSRELCEQEFGAAACQNRSESGSSFWMPFLTGYMVSNVIGDLTDRRYGTPLYRSSSGNWRTYDGWTAQPTGKGSLSVPKKTVDAKPLKPAPVQTKTTVVSRSGFGGGGSSWGG